MKSKKKFCVEGRVYSSPGSVYFGIKKVYVWAHSEAQAVFLAAKRLKKELKYEVIITDYTVTEVRRSKCPLCEKRNPKIKQPLLFH